MSVDDLSTILDNFALNTTLPNPAPAASTASNAVDLAVHGDCIVRLHVGRAHAARVPGSGQPGGPQATIVDAVLRYAQARFPGTACSFKGDRSTADSEIVLCFPKTPTGLRGYQWFQEQGRQCRLPFPDSDITVDIPMKAFVSRPGTPPVTLMLHDVPSDLWKADLAALLLQHFGVQCKVKAEYAPNFNHNGVTYHGLLRKGCIKAELDPASACDFSELPKTVMWRGKAIKLQVYGHRTAPRDIPRQSSPSPPSERVATARRHRRRKGKTAQGARGGAANGHGEARAGETPSPQAQAPPLPRPSPPLQGDPPALPSDGAAQAAARVGHARPSPASPTASPAPPADAPTPLASPSVATATAMAAPAPLDDGHDNPAATDAPGEATRPTPPPGQRGTLTAAPTALPPPTTLAAEAADTVGATTLPAEAGRRVSQRIAAQGPKNYVDKGALPVVGPGGHGAGRPPPEDPIPGAI